MILGYLDKIQKRILIILYLCFLQIIVVGAQEFRLIPQEVYVGDEAEIQFSFSWKGSIFKNAHDEAISIINSEQIEESLNRNYSIKRIQLLPTQDGYMLTLLFVPWKTGLLDFEPMDIATIFNLTTSTLLIDIPEIEIRSVLEDFSEQPELQAPVGPVIIPGTSYALITIAFIILLVIALIIVLLVKMDNIKTLAEKVLGRIWFSNNLKKSCKKLKALSLQGEVLESKIFAARLSFIIREYLENHFIHPFTAETTSNFLFVYAEKFRQEESQIEYDAFVSLYETCVCCDFLHYGGEENHKIPLTGEEKYALIKKTQQNFFLIEKKDEGKKNDCA